MFPITPMFPSAKRTIAFGTQPKEGASQHPLSQGNLQHDIFTKTKAPSVRFGNDSKIIIPKTEEVAFYTATHKASPQVTELLSDAQEFKKLFNSPALTSQHLLYAAIEQALTELDTFKDANRIDSFQHQDETHHYFNLFNRPPVINGFMDEELYRQPVSMQTFKLPESFPTEGLAGKPFKARFQPAKKPSEGQPKATIGFQPEPQKKGEKKQTEEIVNAIKLPFYKPTEFPIVEIQNMLMTYQRRLERMILEKVNTAPPEKLSQEEAFLQGFVSELLSDKRKSDSTVSMLKALKQKESKDAPPLFKEAQEMLQSIQNEAEIAGGNIDNQKNRWLDKLDKMFAEGDMSSEARQALRGEIERYEEAGPQESDTIKTWVDNAFKLPWAKTPTLSPKDIDLKKAQEALDEYLYGMKSVKERIIEYLAMMKQNPTAKPKMLFLVGPPGVGKTAITKIIAKVMGRTYTRASVGGMKDPAEVRGFSRTYVGAIPGFIMRDLQKVHTMNPLFTLDEADKIGQSNGDAKSEEVKAALLNVLDPEQNSEFVDTYFGFKYPLNEVFWMLTGNYAENIPPALADRVEVIDLDRYDDKEKYEIATRFLIPKVMKNQGLTCDQFELAPDAIRRLAQEYTREPGVRKLEEVIDKVASKVTAKRQKSDNPDAFGKVTVTAADLEKDEYLGKPMFDKPKRISGNIPGEMTGLAYTGYGGDTIQIQATAVPSIMWTVGTVTGLPGEMMRESIDYILSYLKKYHPLFKLQNPKVPGYEVSVNIKPVSVGVEGPSAGAATTTAIISELTGIPVREDVAMTGEIDVHGRIGAVGGIKEKIDGAYRAGVKVVFLPKENEDDLKQVPQEQKDAMQIIPVDHINQVLPIALKESPFKESLRPVRKSTKKTKVVHKTPKTVKKP